MTQYRDLRNVDPAWLRGMTQRRMSRRDVLRSAGVGAGVLSMSAILAACGTPESEQVTGAQPGAEGSPEWWADRVAEGADPNVNFTNWPQYIDVAGKDDQGNPIRPTLDAFVEATGIDVTYRADINDNAEFFAQIRPALEAGQDTGHDIIVITNGSQLTELRQRGWLIALDHSLTPNFNENAGPKFVDPAFDPGNEFTMAWQSGMTGLAWNTKFVDEDITSFEQILDPKYKGKVGLMGNDDTPNIVMSWLGIEPTTSTPDDWQAAADWMTQVRDSGQIRKFYVQDYLTAFQQEDLWITMAWSGDIINNFLYEAAYKTFRFEAPQEGGMIWVDNMCIPAKAANPYGAIQVMDWYFQPEIAAQLTEWNAYVSPVPAGGEIVQTDADAAKGANQEILQTIASSPYVFPTPELEARLHSYREFSGEELEQWNDLFQPIYIS
jgi:spermidine/putrescine transport system substrate-binding protein